MKKAVIAAVVAAFAVLLGWRIYGRISEAGGAGPRAGMPAVAVEVTPVSKATVQDSRVLTGSLIPRSQFVVAPKVGGRLERLAVNIGDPVENGQLVAELDDKEYAQQVEQAKAELEVARANRIETESALEVEKREYERIQSLREKKIASESETDAAKAQYQAKEAKYKVAQAQVAQQEAALKAAEVRLSYTRIGVAWEGGGEKRIVGERFVDEGAMLAPNTPIVSILDNSVMIAVVHVIERDYSRVRLGQEAEVATDAFPGRSFRGEVVRMAPLLRESSRQARVEIGIANPDRLLKPGMFVRARVLLAVHEDAAVVPRSALARRGGKPGVFLLDPASMKARFVPLTPGIESDGLVEVLEPALSGQVVTLGHHLLEDGSPVTLPGKEEAPPAGPRGGPR